MSQNWAVKPGAHAVGFTDPAATIGPPVCARLAAISLSDSGWKSPTLLLAGLAQPSSQTTPSGSTFHILAARTHNSWINVLVVSTTAMPVAKVTREPPVRCVYPTDAVSATIGRTRS